MKELQLRPRHHRWLSVLFAITLLTSRAEAFPAPLNGRYVLSGIVDLGGQEIHLEEGYPVVFSNAMIRNGVLWGKGNSIVWDGKEGSLDHVRLEGWWNGKIDDTVFVYREGEDHYPIISSLFHFNDVIITRKEYWIGTWKSISVHPIWQHVQGNNVIFYLTANKGERSSSRWGNNYRYECLFGTRYEPEGNLNYEYHDIEIRDNAATVGQEGWGADISDFCVYHYFGIIGRRLVFDHIRTDGAGGLEKIYNVQIPIDEIVFSHCSSRTNQFAIEILNMNRSVSTAECRKIRIEDSFFYQYPAQKYVGLVSVVGDVVTENLQIVRCTFDGTERAGNLELTSSRNIEVAHCCFRNQFLQSEEETMIENYDCHDNEFHLGRPVGRNPYSFGGNRVRFRNNLFIYEDDIWPIRKLGKSEVIEMSDNMFYLEQSGQERISVEPAIARSNRLAIPKWLSSLAQRVFYNL